MQEQMINLYSLSLVLALMVMGALAHWTKKKLFNEISGNLVDYLFMDYPGRTAATGTAIIAAAGAAAVSGAADIIDPRLIWSMVQQTASLPAMSLFAIGGAFQSGWSFDSLLNKGGKQ